MTPVSARRSATQERLLQAAAQVFAEVGVQGASVEQICDRAGFTRGAFYSNFDSKEQLCLALMEHQAKKSLSALTAATTQLDLAEGRTPTERLRSNVRSLLAALLEQMDSDASVLFTTEMRSYAIRTPSVLPTYRKVQDQVEALFTDLIDSLLSSHQMRLRVRTEDACHLMSALCEHAVLRAAVLGRDRHAAVEELASTVELLLEPA